MASKTVQRSSFRSWKNIKEKISDYIFSKVLIRWITVPHTSKLSPAFT